MNLLRYFWCWLGLALIAGCGETPAHPTRYRVTLYSNTGDTLGVWTTKDVTLLGNGCVFRDSSGARIVVRSNNFVKEELP